MTQQLDLFADPAPVVVGHAQARATDSETSHEAIANLESSGVAEQRRQAILALLHKREREWEPGALTYTEIASKVGIEAVEVMRRLNDLVKAGLVQKGYSQVCSIKGTRCSTWHLC